MLWGFLAEVVLVLHGLFVVWVVAGAFAVWRWPALALLHLPAVAWGAWIEFSAGACPLTPLEVAWRQRAGEAGYTGGFIEHYLTAAIYPEGLTRETQWALGAVVLAINLLIYGLLVFRLRLRPKETPPP